MLRIKNAESQMQSLQEKPQRKSPRTGPLRSCSSRTALSAVGGLQITQSGHLTEIGTNLVYTELKTLTEKIRT